MNWNEFLEWLMDEDDVRTFTRCNLCGSSEPCAWWAIQWPSGEQSAEFLCGECGLAFKETSG